MGIEGKIAKVLNTRELVINRGSEHGVARDMEFAVMEPQFSILDPDTHESLGYMEREKIRVRVFETYPKFSLARTYETYTAHIPSDLEQAVTVHRGRTVTRVRKIITESSGQNAATIGQEGSTVNVGDPVVQINLAYNVRSI